MSYEYDDQKVFEGGHSWYWTWRRRNGKRGGFQIHRLASFENRGGVIRIAGYGTDWQDGKAPKLDVYVSDASQSVHVYLNDKRMVVSDDGSET